MDFNNEMKMRKEDLVSNPEARVPVCLCLDTSGSMAGAPIEELNAGVGLFYQAIREDEAAVNAAEISLVTFGYDWRCIADFAGVERHDQEPCLTASGGTPMGEAVNLALDLLERRQREYRENGVESFRPWLVLMTDGQPNGDPQQLEYAISRVAGMAEARKLVVIPIAIGSHADNQVLQRFSPGRPALTLQGLKFREFFAWLSRSVSVASRMSADGAIPVGSIAGWAQL